jgi:hypothetical protein
MVIINCPDPTCDWAMEDRDPVILGAMLATEMSTHTAVVHSPLAAHFRGQSASHSEETQSEPTFHQHESIQGIVILL